MNKLITTTTLSAGLLLITACGVAPNGPSDLPTIDAQASAPSATSSNASSAATAPTAHTSRRRPGTILPPTNCSMSQELHLEIESRGKGTVEVASNYQNMGACPGLTWELGPGSAAKELAPASFISQQGEGLRLSPAGSKLQGVWVYATAPDRQVAQLYVSFSPSTHGGN